MKAPKILFFSAYLLAALATACADESPRYPMCQCKVDEICVDEQCLPMSDDIAPPPKTEPKP